MAITDPHHGATILNEVGEAQPPEVGAEELDWDRTFGATTADPADAPALAGATVGIAMGATGSAAAIESADVAFTGHDLRLIPQALQHARRGGAIINQNIVLSLAIIVVLLPLAITGVLGLAAVVLVHEVAEVVVILNGLRAARTPRSTTHV